MSPDFLLLALYFAVFLAIAVAARVENRQLLDHAETISAFLHRHVFSAFFAAAWLCLGVGLLLGHFMSGPVYCGTGG
jgi:hypothetical protein